MGAAYTKALAGAEDGVFHDLLESDGGEVAQRGGDVGP